jgi:malonyl CoA-acyl carrier protein transacylase
VQALREQYPQAAFIEFCPKNVLKGLTKKIDRSIEMYTCDTPESISATIEKLLTESEAQKGL